jgi:hypothetical protein
MVVQGNMARHHAPALAGRGITRAGHKRESPPPLLADLDCAVRGPGPVTPRLPGALSLTASPLHRGSACHRPKSHAPGTFALAARRAGCGRGNRRLARTRADGELRRGGRSPRHLDGIEPSHRVRLSGHVRSAGTVVLAGWVRARASRAMKLQIVTSARPIAGTSHLLLRLPGNPGSYFCPEPVGAGACRCRAGRTSRGGRTFGPVLRRGAGVNLMARAI